MKSVILLTLLLTGLLTMPAMASAEAPASPANELKKEIASIMKKQNLQFLKEDVEMVKVEFLINAKNELVILHVEGDNEVTCDQIKKILAFKEVKYRQPRQLMRYKVDLRLVKS